PDAVRIVNEHRRAVTPFRRTRRDVESCRAQSLDDVVDRRGLYLEAEVIHVNAILLAGRRECRMREDVELLAPNLDHGGALTVGGGSLRAQHGETEPLIEIEGPVEIAHLESDVIDGLQSRHECRSLAA